MLAFAIVFAVLILIALLRFGVSVEYGEAGFDVAATAGPLRLHVYPGKDKSENLDKKKTRKVRRNKKPKQKAKRKDEKKTSKKPEVKKPGSLSTLLSVLTPIKNTLGRLRRRLLIKKLIIYFTMAGDDPSTTAFAYGAANAAIGTLVPVLEKSFRIKRRDLRAFTNFCSDKPVIYVNAAISIAVWEIIYIMLAMLPVLLKLLSMAKASTDRKDEIKNGEAPDK